MTWGHHILLRARVAGIDAPAYCPRATIETGSRAVPGVQADARLHERPGSVVHNLNRTLPPPSSELAQKSLKDPYIFDFLGGEEEASEREAARSPVAHVERFLTMLGVGFAFVGRQVPPDIGGTDDYFDLLLYDVKLLRVAPIQA